MSFKLTVNKNETVTGTSSWVKYPDLKWKFKDLLTSNLSSYIPSCLETISTWIFHYNFQLIIAQSKCLTIAPSSLLFSWLSFQPRALPYYPGQGNLGVTSGSPLPFTCHLTENWVLLVLPVTCLWSSLDLAFASFLSPPPSRLRSLSHHGWIPRKTHPTGLTLFRP